MQKVGKNTSIFRYKWLSVEAIQIAEKEEKIKTNEKMKDILI